MTEVRKFEIVPLSACGGAEIVGLDASAETDPETVAALWQVLSNHTVVVLRDQNLTPAQHVAFSRRFADLEVHIKNEFTLPGHPEVFVLSNIVENGRAIGVTNFAESWHFDGSHSASPPVGALLYALEIPPEGGDTQFANMYLAYEGLPAAMKDRIETLSAIHSYHTLQAHLYPDRPLSEPVKAATPDRLQPLVKIHPRTQRRALSLGAEIVTGIAGWPEPQGTDLVAALLAHATRPDFVYTHKWRTGDLLIWDNRCTMHRVLPFDQARHRRRMHRTTLVSR